MDSSGSVEARHFNKMKAFVSSIIRDLDLENDKTRVGVMTYSSSTRLNYHLNGHKYVKLHIYKMCIRCGGPMQYLPSRLAVGHAFNFLPQSQSTYHIFNSMMVDVLTFC